ncbi:MAG: tRNA pseudouridine(38-40) synthase TruA [Pseudomonadota bacterium]
MPRYKLTLDYDGGPFVGWQRQDVGRSVQGDLERALARLGERGDGEGGGPAVTGAGRTDAGVHALGQAAHVDLERDWAPFRLSEALNHHLKPAPIGVIGAEVADPAFHARFDAVERRYLYRIAVRRAPLTLERGRAWRVGHGLDVAAMAAGAAHLVGRHDFTTFRSAQCQAQSPVKTLDAVEVEATAEGAAFRLRARSFLHNQVRSIVGTLERVGAGKWPPERVAEALAAADRAACGPVAPPDGLYLVAVGYPDSAA